MHCYHCLLSNMYEFFPVIQCTISLHTTRKSRLIYFSRVHNTIFYTYDMMKKIRKLSEINNEVNIQFCQDVCVYSFFQLLSIIIERLLPALFGYAIWIDYSHSPWLKIIWGIYLFIEVKAIEIRIMRAQSTINVITINVIILSSNNTYHSVKIKGIFKG